jgi:hypothetical protein
MDSVELGREAHEEPQGFTNGGYDMALAQVVSCDVSSPQEHKALERRVPRHVGSESEKNAAHYSASTASASEGAGHLHRSRRRSRGQTRLGVKGHCATKTPPVRERPPVPSSLLLPAQLRTNVTKHSKCLLVQGRRPDLALGISPDVRRRQPLDNLERWGCGGLFNLDGDTGIDIRVPRTRVGQW